MKQRIEIGPFEADIGEGLLFSRGERVPVRPQVMRALIYLARNQGRLVSRQELARALWADTFVDEGQSLNVVIRSLRKTLGDDPKSPRYIETIPTRGYRFIAENHREKNSWHFRWLWAGLAGATIAVSLMFVAVGTSESNRIAGEARPQTVNDISPEAKAAYLKGIRLFRDGNMLESRTMLQQVVVLAPEFAGGHYWLGKTHSGQWGATLKNAEQAEPHLRTALALNPGLSDAYAELGNVVMIRYLDARQARDLADMAISLDPSNINAWTLKADASLAVGDAGQALDYMNRINEIDPLHHTARAGHGWVAFMAGDYMAAVQHCRFALQSGESRTGFSRACLIEAYLGLGQFENAKAEAVTLMQEMNADNVSVQAVQASTPADALQVYFRWRLGRLEAGGRMKADAYNKAIFLLRVGEKDAALDRLNDVVRTRQYPQIAFLASDIRLAELTASPVAAGAFTLYSN